MTTARPLLPSNRAAAITTITAPVLTIAMLMLPTLRPLRRLHHPPPRHLHHPMWEEAVTALVQWDMECMAVTTTSLRIWMRTSSAPSKPRCGSRPNTAPAYFYCLYYFPLYATYHVYLLILKYFHMHRIWMVEFDNRKHYYLLIFLLIRTESFEFQKK